MKVKIYNKLVRDKIPEIIRNDNKECEIEILNKKDLEELLNKKLKEEMDEFIESGEIEELADILEVIHGIIELKNIRYKELEDIRQTKKQKRGGFSKGIKLTKVIE